MSIVKVVEVIAQSDRSWEEAAQFAVSEAAQTVRGIQNIYISDFQAVVNEGKIVKYRVNAKISFLLDSREVEPNGQMAATATASSGGNKTM